jgi:hypothetical protein
VSWLLALSLRGACLPWTEKDSKAKQMCNWH